MTERSARRFDHHDADFARDPWAEYRSLRETCPVAWSDTYDDGFWVVSRYDDVKACALNPRVFSSAEDDLLIPAEHPGWLLPVESDPPATTEYRRLINHLFTVGAVRALEPSIEQWTAETIDVFIEDGECDLVRDLANRVPAKVTMALVGWPLEDGLEIVDAIRTFVSRRHGDPVRQEAGTRLSGVRARIEASIVERRRQPGDDLVSHLLAGRIGDRELTHDEIVALVMMVLFGGIDTTVAAIGNMLMYLDRDRAMRRRLIDDPSLIPVAVDDLLRYEAPVQGFSRFAREPVAIRDQQIAAGEVVYLSWASANRDGDVFVEADTVRLDREPNPHLTFGIGVHRCVGATLARAELSVVLAAVLARMPDYEVEHDGVVHTQTAGTVYARMAIPARFTPGARRFDPTG